MSDWVVGYAVGMASGLAIGLIAGRKQKPWSEMSEKQRKFMIGLIAAGIILLVAGIVVFIYIS